MGLHAQIHQSHLEVTIALSGRFQRPELNQLRAILAHFYGRGCRNFVLDLSRMSPLSPFVEAYLHRLIGQSGSPASRQVHGRAIRLLAESPAASPQRGCGGLSFPAS
jgi:hypothetical protein